MKNIPMLLDCPDCTRSYHVYRADLLGGRTLICPRCKACWAVDEDGRNSQPTIPTPRLSYAAIANPIDPVHTPSVLARIRPIMGAAASLVLAILLIGARDRIVHTMPRTAALYNAVGLAVNSRGLEFVAVTPARLDPGSPQVTISGIIHNVSTSGKPLARLAYEVRDVAGVALMAWTEKPPAKALGTGQRVAFTSMSHHLPEGAQSVLVRFETDERTPLLVAGNTTP